MNMTHTESLPVPLAPVSCEPELLTPEQLARRLNVTRRTLSNWSRDKIIPMVKVGRICRFDLQKVKTALERYEQGAATR